MKKCPTCGKEFEDSMRFCQVDGTELAAAQPELDPYATMVGHKLDLTPEAPAEDILDVAPAEKPPEEAQIHETTGSIPIAPPDEILELPGVDPLKTMYVSDSELKEALGSTSDSEPTIVADAPPNFGDAAPPPSPFSVPEMPAEESRSTPFAEPEPPPSISPSVQFGDPFQSSAEWTPPPVPDAAWQNQQIGSNTPFQPPAAGAVNQTLPIVSLILGIVSICCYVSPITGIAAVITGYLGMKNANNDPRNYGGKGLAIAGMAMGGIFLLIGLAYYIFVILVYAGIFGASMLQGY